MSGNADRICKRGKNDVQKEKAPSVCRRPILSTLYFYCTFAPTDEFALRVRVQVLVLAPPLEHAPDQIASRPLATLRVMTVPGANCAEPVLPVATLKPAGLETTRSPLRPLAVTASDIVV